MSKYESLLVEEDFYTLQKILTKFLNDDNTYTKKEITDAGIILTKITSDLKKIEELKGEPYKAPQEIPFPTIKKQEETSVSKEDKTIGVSPTKQKQVSARHPSWCGCHTISEEDNEFLDSNTNNEADRLEQEWVHSSCSKDDKKVMDMKFRPNSSGDVCVPYDERDTISDKENSHVKKVEDSKTYTSTDDFMKKTIIEPNPSYVDAYHTLIEEKKDEVFDNITKNFHEMLYEKANRGMPTNQENKST
jgi:hypothetical protein